MPRRSSCVQSLNLMVEQVQRCSLCMHWGVCTAHLCDLYSVTAIPLLPSLLSTKLVDFRESFALCRDYFL